MHVWMYAGPSAVRAPEVATRNSGTFTAVPAMLSASTQVASGVAPWRHAACVAAGTWPGGATTTLPSTGTSAPPSAWSLRSAFTGPSTVPGAWVAVTVVPAGTKMRRMNVASSAELCVVLKVVAVPTCLTSSFGVVYAASADGTAMSAATEASPAATVQIRPLMDALL